MSAEPPSPKKLRWRRNKRDERARKAPLPPAAPSPEMVARAQEEARAGVHAAVMPEMVSAIVSIRDHLRRRGVPFSAVDMFGIWYVLRNDPRRPNRDIWRMSDSAREFTVDVWVERTLVEHQLGPGKATAGKIAKRLAEQGLGRGYTEGSLRVMVWRALDKIKRIQLAAQLADGATLNDEGYD